MTTAAELVERVRSNLNEPLRNEENQRSNEEILKWLTEGQHTYVNDIPADSVPMLVTESPVSSGSPIPIPLDYLKPFEVKVSQTISGTTMGTETAIILQVDNSYMVDHWPSGSLGVYAIFREDGIKIGPSASGGQLVYLRCPAPLVDLCDTFELGCGHSDPVVFWATAMGLAKISDVDAERYLAAYQQRVRAENMKFGQELEVEKVP